MKIRFLKFIFVFPTVFFLFFITSACKNYDADFGNSKASSNNSNITTNTDGANQAKDDVDELGKIIKLNFTPQEAAWLETNLNDSKGGTRNAAPIGKKLVAVLKFSAEDAGQIVSQAEKYQPAAAAQIDAENWFPAELIAQSQLSGDETLKGTSYAAGDFLQPPFNTGRITRIDNTDYFVLEANSP